MPDFKQGGKAEAVALGCAGVLVLQFTDNVIVNVDGPDLHVFEVDKDIEPVSIAISTDGKDWLAVGQLARGIGSIDIAPYVKPEQSFNFVKLTYLQSNCRGN